MGPRSRLQMANMLEVVTCRRSSPRCCGRDGLSHRRISADALVRRGQGDAVRVAPRPKAIIRATRSFRSRRCASCGLRCLWARKPRAIGRRARLRRTWPREGVFASWVFDAPRRGGTGREVQAIMSQGAPILASSARYSGARRGRFDRDLAGQAARRRVAEPYDS